MDKTKNILIGIVFGLVVIICIYLAVDSYRCGGCGKFAGKDLLKTESDKEYVHYDKISKKYEKGSGSGTEGTKIRETTISYYKCKTCGFQWEKKSVDIRAKKIIE